MSFCSAFVMHSGTCAPKSESSVEEKWSFANRASSGWTSSLTTASLSNLASVSSILNQKVIFSGGTPALSYLLISLFSLSISSFSTVGFSFSGLAGGVSYIQEGFQTHDCMIVKIIINGIPHFTIEHVYSFWNTSRLCAGAPSFLYLSIYISMTISFSEGSTSISLLMTHFSKILNQLQSDIYKAREWVSSNPLTLKCKFMLVSRKWNPIQTPHLHLSWCLP